MNFTLDAEMAKFFKGSDELKNQEITEIDYLVDRLIPRGTLCSLVGESDTGKKFTFKAASCFSSLWR